MPSMIERPGALVMPRLCPGGCGRATGGFTRDGIYSCRVCRVVYAVGTVVLCRPALWLGTSSARPLWRRGIWAR